MSDVSAPVTFVTGSTVQAADFNSNYASIVDYVNARNSGSESWDKLYVSSASVVPLIANNSTGVQDIFSVLDNGVSVFSVADGGYISAPYQFYARMHLSTPHVITSPAAKISFDSGTQTVTAVVSGTFTVPENGKYLVGCAVMFPQNFLSPPRVVEPTLLIYKDGAEYSRKGGQTSISSDGTIWFADILALSENQTVEIYTSNGGFSGVAQIEANQAKSYLLVMKIS